MARIKQQYPIVGGIIKAEELQFDINQLFTTINTLDKDNLQRPGGEFDWGTTKLINVVDPTGTIDDSNDLQVAVTKNYLKSVLNTKFDSSGNWHKHDNKSVLDSINSAGSGDIITSDERNRLPSSDEKDAMSNANSPSSSNPFATMNDIPSVPAIPVVDRGYVLTQGLTLTSPNIQNQKNIYDLDSTLSSNGYSLPSHSGYAYIIFDVYIVGATYVYIDLIDGNNNVRYTYTYGTNITNIITPMRILEKGNNMPVFTSKVGISCSGTTLGQEPYINLIAIGLIE